MTTGTLTELEGISARKDLVSACEQIQGSVMLLWEMDFLFPVYKLFEIILVILKQVKTTN